MESFKKSLTPQPLSKGRGEWYVMIEASPPNPSPKGEGSGMLDKQN